MTDDNVTEDSAVVDQYDTSSNVAATPKPSPSTMHRSYSSSSIATTPSGSPLFYSSGLYNNSIDHIIPSDKISLLELLDPISTSTTGLLSKKYNQVKEKSYSKLQKLRSDTTKKTDRYINEIKDFEGLKKKLLERVEKLDKRLAGVFYTSKIEKLFYSFALYNIFIAGLVIGKYPQYFHVYYSLLAFVLMPIRFYTYWKKAYHYFLADLCYFVNFLLLIFIWLAPNSVHLYTVCFAFTFGTLSWAVITWRNSLVLHSIDKFTSSFIHVVPPVVMLVITHILPYEYKIERFPGAAKLTNWNFFQGILWTSLYYLIWQSLYHYFITIRKASKIKAGRVTSFEWLRKSFANQWLGKFVNSLPDPFPVVAFTLIQYGYQLLTMSICPIWFTYEYLAIGFITFIFFVASYNGATYYIDFYGKRLEKEVTRLQTEIANMHQGSNTFQTLPETEDTPQKPPTTVTSTLNQ